MAPPSLFSLSGANDRKSEVEVVLDVNIMKLWLLAFSDVLGSGNCSSDSSSMLISNR